jgi:hypothetical protein
MADYNKRELRATSMRDFGRPNFAGIL